ncbi:hypothetical protein [Halohasta litorea]|uniref:DUF3592 domain-containing protein n=1 Tax=Halohasta litorea TaxID=869891 RepID=A0ABD6DCB1_9EURY|nr:hypothetical protein [Halohasta litorea]
MNLTRKLMIIGVFFLIAGILLPAVEIGFMETDRDYIYTIEPNGSWCGDLVYGSTNFSDNNRFQKDYNDLSTSGRKYFKQALIHGHYVIEDKNNAARDFTYINDEQAAGIGCYAINYQNKTYALETDTESQVTTPIGGVWPFVLGGTFLLFGFGLLIIASLWPIKTKN